MKRAAICAAILLAIAEAKKLRQEEQPVEDGVVAEAKEVEPVEEAEEEEEGAVEYLEDYNVPRPGPEWYRWTKFVYGVFAGTLGPLTNRAQSYGCKGATSDLGWALYTWA